MAVGCLILGGEQGVSTDPGSGAQSWASGHFPALIPLTEEQWARDSCLTPAFLCPVMGSLPVPLASKGPVLYRGLSKTPTLWPAASPLPGCIVFLTSPAFAHNVGLALAFGTHLEMPLRSNQRCSLGELILNFFFNLEYIPSFN